MQCSLVEGEGSEKINIAVTQQLRGLPWGRGIYGYYGYFTDISDISGKYHGRHGPSLTFLTLPVNTRFIKKYPFIDQGGYPDRKTR